MPILTIPNNNWINNVTPVDATLFNANWNQIQTIVNGIDNANIGAAGIFASQIKPTSAANATFGGSQTYTFPGSISVPSGSTYAFGYLFSTATGLGVYGGTGAPSFSAPNGTVALRYDSATTPMYINTSGASSSGTTWTGVNLSLLAPYSKQSSVAISYTTTGSEANATPGTLASISNFTTPASSPGTNNQWRVFARAFANFGDSGHGALSNSIWGIGSTTAGSNVCATFSTTSGTGLTITGANSDTFGAGPATPFVRQQMYEVEWSATFANGTTITTISALLGVNSTASAPVRGGLLVWALPD